MSDLDSMTLTEYWLDTGDIACLLECPYSIAQQCIAHLSEHTVLRDGQLMINAAVFDMLLAVVPIVQEEAAREFGFVCTVDGPYSLHTLMEYPPCSQRLHNILSKPQHYEV